ncbi:MAG: hypothetical protein QXP73_06275 [Candidatus Methanomethylicaceae archaeon]|nr:hypothetical protein [Candidatus Verstraetearchaeota archaeon]
MIRQTSRGKATLVRIMRPLGFRYGPTAPADAGLKNPNSVSLGECL